MHYIVFLSTSAKTLKSITAQWRCWSCVRIHKPKWCSLPSVDTSTIWCNSWSDSVGGPRPWCRTWRLFSAPSQAWGLRLGCAEASTGVGRRTGAEELRSERAGLYLRVWRSPPIRTLTSTSQRRTSKNGSGNQEVGCRESSSRCPSSSQLRNRTWRTWARMWERVRESC